jgi:serine O-acetyltransferase
VNDAVDRGTRNRKLARVRAKQPRFVAAVATDTKMCGAVRGEQYKFANRFDAMFKALRLMWVSDAFIAQVCYRAQARLDALRIPVLPRVMQRLAITTGHVNISPTVIVQPGVCFAHGQVVVDGFVEIDRGVVILPWVTISPGENGVDGPVVKRDVKIGTGARVLGAITVQRNAQIGANAVVVEDVPPGATVVGVPARVVQKDSEI